MKIFVDGNTQTVTAHVVLIPHDNFPITQEMDLFFYIPHEIN